MSSTEYEVESNVIAPLPGPQTNFLSTSADIAIYGGSMGSGKSYALLMEAARHCDNPRFEAVAFRRTSPELTAPGGLWPTSQQIYPQLGAHGRSSPNLDWTFESGAKIILRHLQHAKNVQDWKGSSLALILFDELTHFEESMFWGLVSRNRSTCGIRPYIRASTNPTPPDDPLGGWVNRMISWWIDRDSGYPIPSRSGVIRWFIRRNGELIWADTKEELIEKYTRDDLPEGAKGRVPRPKSLTFVPGKLEDNTVLESIDPDYRANLEAMPEVEKERYLGGNWKIRLMGGMVYKTAKIEIVDALPADLRYCRAWDLAATDGAGDWTVGLNLGTDNKGTFYIADLVRGQWEASYRDAKILQTAVADDEISRTRIRIPQDPAAAGKSEAARLVKMLVGHAVRSEIVSGDKVTRATGVASQLNAGNVKMLRGPWNNDLMSRLDAFPTKDVPDDDSDALADAFSELKLGVITALIANSQPKEPEGEERPKYNALTEDVIRDLWERIIRDESVCPQWKGPFAQFRDDIGAKPSAEHVLRLRDENEMYSPSNCWWGKDGEEPPKAKRNQAFVSR